MKREVDVYAACDRAIRAMDRQNVEAFGRLKGTDWKRSDTIKTVMAVYTASKKRARKRYYEIGFEAFLLGLYMCGIEGRKARKMAENTITAKWVDEILEQTDFVTLYRFDMEEERKAYRLAEALEVSENRDAEIDKALRAWSKQVAQYAINVTDYAMVQAFQDAGVVSVRWITRDDERVCGECNSLNRQTFKVDEVPRKPHINCRCTLEPILEEEEE